jgi:hypothetical protein
MKDSISVERIKQLHPKVQEIFTKFIEECETTFNITLRIMLPVFRTISEQNALYTQGRTSPGKIVTNAKGGSSFHNYGLAIDLCRVDAEDSDHDGDSKEILWDFDNGKLDPIAKKYNLEWGGDWHTIKDKPHFQYTFGKTWQDLFKMVNAKQVDAQGYVNL